MKQMERITCQISLELLTDSIFGSGFSSPGGADIGVQQREDGYPFLQGSTLKGLLRESLENLFAWRGEGDCAPLLGAQDWHGEHSERRIFLTDLQLQSPPEEVADCYSTRNFTAIGEDRLVKEGSLRTAQCIVGGHVFQGILECNEKDFPTLEEGFSAIKWLGTLRNRGFGRVKFSLTPLATEQNPISIPPTTCISYSFITKLPLMMTKAVQNLDNHKESYSYIPGAAIRGLVIHHLAQQEPVWFEENKTALLSEKTRFLPAYPQPREDVLIPTIQGFYESKTEEQFCHIALSDALEPGLKRAKIGQFCHINGDAIQGFSPKTQGCTRILLEGAQKKTEMFSQRALSAQQTFRGYIILDEADFAPKIAQAFTPHFWLGGDRQEGFGLCQRLDCVGVDFPSYQQQDQLPHEETQFFLLVLSPLADWDDFGNAGGLNLPRLAQNLEVDWVKIRQCATSVEGYGSYNRTWRAESPRVQMYTPGSLFRLETDRPPSLERMKEIQRSGLGLGRSEGYGAVLFLSLSSLASITHKEKISLQKEVERKKKMAGLRVARYGWIMEQSKKIQGFTLSQSQLGSIQAICENSISSQGDSATLMAHLGKNRDQRGAAHGKRFAQFETFVSQLFETPPDFVTSQVPADDWQKKVMELLVDLLNYSRKAQIPKGGDR